MNDLEAVHLGGTDGELPPGPPSRCPLPKGKGFQALSSDVSKIPEKLTVPFDSAEFSKLGQSSEGFQGEAHNVAALFYGCRQYLSLVADAEVGDDLRVKMSVSDLVQETFVEAQRNIHQFRGVTRVELLAWLRQILLHRLSRLYARYRQTKKRNIVREWKSPQTSLNFLDQLYDSEQSSPSGCAGRAEKIELVRKAIGHLPVASRKVVVLRYRDHLKFSEIGKKLGRSPDAVRMLWHRAIDRLAAELGPYHE